MASLASIFSVVLRHDLPETELELLSYYAGMLVSKSGQVLLHFTCTNIDATHGYYLKMDTFKSGADESTCPIRIPHHFVLMISGDNSNPSPIGFTDMGFRLIPPTGAK